MADEQSGPPPAERPAPSDAPDILIAAEQPSEDVDYTDRGVPTFDSVREKIETRFGTAQGARELAADAPEGRTVEEQYEARQKAAAERLEQIRSAMRSEGGRAFDEDA
jgi:phage shock protein A